MITTATITDRMRAVLDGEAECEAMNVLLDIHDLALPIVDPPDPREWRAALINMAVELELCVYFRRAPASPLTRSILLGLARDADFGAALDARGLLR
jgi:hypothetical protein